MKNHFLLAAATLLSLSAAAPLTAQQINSNGGSWMSGAQPGIQTNEFWNNNSYDGGDCNVGFFVAGTGFGPCINQSGNTSPMNWVNSAYLANSAPSISSTTGFDFAAGDYFLTFLGQIAGANPHRIMGVESSDGSNGLNGLSSIQFAPAQSVLHLQASTAWKFFLQSYRPTGTQFYNSMDDSQQFAVFADSHGGNGDFTGRWLVGSEDNSCVDVDAANGCPDLADYDYNDGLVLITVAPEPATYALVSLGLLAIGGAVRRRRNANRA